MFLQHRPVAIAVILAVAGGLAASTQSGHVHTQTIQTTPGASIAPSGVIDGSVHSELISDQEAITMFWIAVMEPTSAAAPVKGRFAAKTGGMGLSSPDAALIWSAAVTFNAQFALTSHRSSSLQAPREIQARRRPRWPRSRNNALQWPPPSTNSP